MNWASWAIDKLQKGQEATITPHGNSMRGKVESGDEVVLEPVTETTDLKAGDIVLCRVKGRTFCHLIVTVQGDRFQIGNNRGGINGWVGRNCIYGRAVRVAGKPCR